jgi:thymidylate synthase (FAD)
MAKELVAAAEAMLDKPVSVLDHGFVTLIDYMGSDAAIVKAARNSIGGETGKKTQSDVGLIRYLLRARHTSPFEMAEIKLQCKMPIFVARQWIRHRTASVNELSGRYTELPEEFYVPAQEDICYQSTVNRQGSEGEVDKYISENFRELHIENAETAFKLYRSFLGQDSGLRNVLTDEQLEQLQSNGGIARETARIGLPLSTYTMWYWKIDLKNLLHFLWLRLDPHAQKEIRAYAEVIAEIVKQWVPVTWAAFEDFQLQSMSLTRIDRYVIRTMFFAYKKHAPLDRTRILSKFPTEREKTEFKEKLDMLGMLELFDTVAPE